jgi:hypothetical protein
MKVTCNEDWRGYTIIIELHKYEDFMHPPSQGERVAQATYQQSHALSDLLFWLSEIARHLEEAERRQPVIGPGYHELAEQEGKP